MLSNSSGVPFAPREIILSISFCQPARSRCIEVARVTSWQPLQTFIVSALPGASGMFCAHPVPTGIATKAAERIRQHRIARKELRKRDIVDEPRSQTFLLPFNVGTKSIEVAIIRSKIQLAVAGR